MRYERKIPFDLRCGVHLTREILLGKWRMDVLYHLAQGVRRPGQLHQKLPKATRRALHLQLNQLEAHGFVTKTIFAVSPPRVEYQLTALGESLLPLITVLGQWGEAHRPHLEQVLTASPEAPLPAARPA